MNARHVVFELRDERQVEIANSQEGQEFGIEEVPAEAAGASMGSHHSASWEGSELGGGGCSLTVLSFSGGQKRKESLQSTEVEKGESEGEGTFRKAERHGSRRRKSISGTMKGSNA